MATHGGEETSSVYTHGIPCLVQYPQLGYWLSHFVFLDRHFSQALGPRVLVIAFSDLGEDPLLPSLVGCEVRLRFAGLGTQNVFACFAASGWSIIRRTKAIKCYVHEGVLNLYRHLSAMVAMMAVYMNA